MHRFPSNKSAGRVLARLAVGAPLIATGSGPFPSADGVNGHPAILSSGGNNPANVIRLDPQRPLTEQGYAPRRGTDLRLDGAADRGYRRNGNGDVRHLRPFRFSFACRNLRRARANFQN